MGVAHVLILLAVIATAALWLVGAWFTPSPVWLGVLLGVAALSGIALMNAGIFIKRGLLKKPWPRLLGFASLVSAGIFVVLVLRNEEGPLPVVPGNVAAPERPDKLRVVDFNVLHGYPQFTDQEARFRDMLAALTALAPDILVLQEAWHTPAHGNLVERLGKELGFHHVYARANGSRRLIGFEEGAGILSRYPILEAQRVLLTPREPLYENRIAVVAVLDVGGEKLRIGGAHLTTADLATATDQARRLLRHVPPQDLLLVCGDFNAPSDSGPVTTMTARGLVDALPGGIDHLFVPVVPGSWQLERVAWTCRPEDLVTLIGKRVEISDHPAIVADFVRTR